MITFPGRIPITIHPIFFLVAALIGWINSQEAVGTLIWMFVIFFSVLVHEMGHALTSLIFGQKPSIAFVAMGGLTTRKGNRLPLWAEFLVVLNGPLFGLTLFLLSAFVLANLGEVPDRLGFALQVSIFVNLIWSLLNLIPVGPLDGSRLLAIALEGALGSNGIRLAHIVGIVIGIGIGLYGFFVGGVLIGLIFFLLGFESFRAFQATRGMTEQDRDLELQAMFQDAQELREDFPEQAREKLVELRQATGKGLLFTASTEVLAQMLSDEGEFEEAFGLLLPEEKNLSPHSMRLLHRLAYYMRDAETVGRIGDFCFQIDRSYETAFINAVAQSMLSNPEASLGWLQQAAEEGMPDLLAAVARREFDSLRTTPEFQAFIDSISET